MVEGPDLHRLGSARPGHREIERRPGRPLDASLRQRVLRATREIVSEQGWRGFSVDAVASRAGVSKASIYRRWPGWVSLVTEAVADAGSAMLEDLPSTGSLEGDVRAMLRRVLGFLRSTEGRFFAEVWGAMMQEAALRNEVLKVVREQREKVMGPLLRRARDRGEVREGAPVAVAADVVMAALLAKARENPEALDEEFADMLAEVVLKGVLVR